MENIRTELNQAYDKPKKNMQKTTGPQREKEFMQRKVGVLLNAAERSKEGFQVLPLKF